MKAASFCLKFWSKTNDENAQGLHFKCIFGASDSIETNEITCNDCVHKDSGGGYVGGFNRNDNAMVRYQ